LVTSLLVETILGDGLRLDVPWPSRAMARNPRSVQDVPVAEQAGGAGCTVVVLAPHQGDGATLCRLPSAVGPEAACALPTVAVNAEPDIEEVIREVSRLAGEPVRLLRANAAAWDSGFDTTALIVDMLVAG
jgi:hypothetical protein